MKEYIKKTLLLFLGICLCAIGLVIFTGLSAKYAMGFIFLLGGVGLILAWLAEQDIDPLERWLNSLRR